MLKVFTITALVLGITAPSLWAQAAADWSRIPADPRSAATAGAMDAVSDGTGAIANNPAGLGIQEGTVLTFNHDFWVDGLAMEHGALAGQSGKVGYGISADYLDFGALTSYSVSNGQAVASGSINPQALAVATGLGFPVVDGFYAGASVRFLGQNLAYAWESTWSFNAGAIYRQKDGFAAGISFLNMGQGLDGFGLPFEVKASVSSRLDMNGDAGKSTHAIIGSLGWDYLPSSSSAGFSIGGEYWYRSLLALRAGYRVAPYGLSDNLQGLAFGGGVRLDRFEVNYALITLGASGNANQLSLSMLL